MLRIRIFALALAALVLHAEATSAAVIGFSGAFNARTFSIGGPGFFGPVPPAVPFHMTLTVADGASPGAILGGTFHYGPGTPPPLTIIGGTVTLAENGAADTATFLIDVEGITTTGTANGQMNIGLTGDFFTSSAISQATFAGITEAGGSTPAFTFTDGSAGFNSYSGSATAVPEPSSMAFAGLLVGGVAWRRRRKAKAAA